MYHHTFDYEHMLDVVYEDGKFLLKFDHFDPIEVPREFGVNLGDLIYEIIDDSTKKERDRIIGLVSEYLAKETQGKSSCSDCDVKKSTTVLTSLITDLVADA